MFIRFDTIHEREKIAVFTYRSPHFCFPWGPPGAITLNVVWREREFDAYKLSRPCDYHAICCIDGKTIQCLPNPSQHVPIYLQ